jgi:tetratricopeptide (TPR) repeat protein
MRFPLTAGLIFLTLFSASAQTLSLSPGDRENLIEYGHNHEGLMAFLEEKLPRSFSPRDNAVALNKAGFALYRESEYLAALGVFRLAIQQDPTYPYPHYNYICTEALFFAQWNDPCYDGGPSEFAVEALKTAISLSPQYRDKMLQDSDLRFYRSQPWFQELAGARIDRQEGVRQILREAPFWIGHRPGAFPSQDIHILGDGRFELQSFDMAALEAGDMDNLTKKQTGRYTISELGEIHFHLENGPQNGQRFTGRLSHTLWEGQESPRIFLRLYNEQGEHFLNLDVYGDPCSA